MKLKTNTIITLENNKRYLLLNETVFQEKNYFLAMEVLENKEVIPDNVIIFEEIKDYQDIYIEKVIDNELLQKLTTQLKAQL